jgi:hypothetical protein
MSPTRKAIPISVRQLALHEAGYRCANPCCRTILTLDLHHLDYVSEGGKDISENLLALCPNCHELHHRGHIPTESLRAWKFTLLALNEAFDRRSVDMLLALAKMNHIGLSGDGILMCAPLIASDLVQHHILVSHAAGLSGATYAISLTERGKAFLEAWKAGRQTTLPSTGTNFAKSAV